MKLLLVRKADIIVAEIGHDIDVIIAWALARLATELRYSKAEDCG